MQLQGNFKKFFEAVMHEMEGVIKPKVSDPALNKEIGQAILNTIFDLDGPKEVQKNPEDKAIFVANKIFRPLSEILTNIEALENISVYAASFPYRRQGISRLDYLKYHIENYLNELYILKNRLISYLTIIERAYKKCDRASEISKELKPVYQIVSGTLDGYINIRGSHVHDKRYSDTDFDRLTNLSLLSMSQDKEFSNIFQGMFVEEYRKTRKKWVGKMKRDLEAIEQLLEIFFSPIVNSLVINGKLIYPSNVHWV